MPNREKKSSNSKLSIVIVNYNSTKYLNILLKSLNNIKNIIGEIIIVDNNSNDIIKLKTAKKITILKNNENLGFSKAVNQGIKRSKYKFILLLNPDCVLIDNSIKKIFKKIKTDKQIGIIGGKIVNGKKNQYTATAKPTFATGLFEFTNLKKIFPKNKFSKKFWIENKIQKISKPINVTSLCGAFILFRKKFNNKAVLFDEKFFLYMEDIDFGIELKKRGAKIIFDPRSKIKHIGGCSNKSKYNTVLRHWYWSRNYFFNKHLKKWQSKILSTIFFIEKHLLYFYHYLKNEPTE